MPLSPSSGRLVTRLMIVTVLVGTIMAVIGALLVARSARSALRTEIAQRHALIAEELAGRFDLRVGSMADQLRVETSRRAITGLEAEADGDLRVLVSASPLYDELLLVDTTGRPVAAAAVHFLADADDFRPRPDVVAAVEEGFHVAIVEDFPPVLEIGVPVEHPPGTVRGALLARVPLELLARDVQRLDPTTGAVRFLVSQEGRILVHPSRDLMLGGGRFPAEAVIDRPGRQGVMEFEGERWLVAAAPVDVIDAAVVVQQAEAEALRSVARRLWELSLIVIAVMAAVVLGVTLTGSRLLRPLGPLTESVDRIARGERGVRVGVSTSDEIGVLARRFDQMAESLDRRDEELRELHRLSLLISSRADNRREVAEEVARGVQALLAADGCAVFGPGDGEDIVVELSSGEVPDPGAAQRLANASLGGAQPLAEQANGTHALALPLSGLEGPPRGALVILREEPFGEDEVRLGEAFASFAGVALQNVRRLEVEQALVQELQAAVDRKRRLIGSITHDLRVPLDVIERFSARLAEEWSTMSQEERVGLLEQIRDQAEQLDQLVVGLLEFAMVERGQRPLNIYPVPVREVVKSATEAVASLLGDRPIERDLPDLEVLADPALLIRVLVHLLSNAARFSPPGTPISVRAEPTSGSVRIEVADEGIGMTADEASRAFEPFWRARESGGEVPGMGLGLALAAEYVRSMDGTVRVESQPGRGSRFSVLLPEAGA